MIEGLDHIGIAVDSLEDALGFYVRRLGLQLQSIETVSNQGVKMAFLQLGDSSIELLEPTDASSPVARFLETRGPGMHHICLEVEDIEQMLESLSRRGVELVDKEPRRGGHGKLVAFLHPRSAGGVLVELSQSVS